jgi:hypothetical protein
MTSPLSGTQLVTHLDELILRSDSPLSASDIRRSLLLCAREAVLSVRVYTTKDGEQKSYGDPNYPVAIKACEVLGKLDGHLERTTGKGKQPEEQEGHEDVDQQLADYALSRPGLLKRIDERRGKRVAS